MRQGDITSFSSFSAVGALSHGHVQELPAEERHGRASALRLRLGRRGAQQREEEEQGPGVRRYGGAFLSLRDQTWMADHPPDPQPQVRVTFLSCFASRHKSLLYTSLCISRYYFTTYVFDMNICSFCSLHFQTRLITPISSHLSCVIYYQNLLFGQFCTIQAGWLFFPGSYIRRVR